MKRGFQLHNCGSESFFPLKLLKVKVLITFIFPLKMNCRKNKRVAEILYLCYRTRIEIEFNFEFGFKKTNPVRSYFNGDALIEVYMISSHVAIFQRKETHNGRFLQPHNFLLSFCSVIPSRKASGHVYPTTHLKNPFLV